MAARRIWRVTRRRLTDKRCAHDCGVTAYSCAAVHFCLHARNRNSRRRRNLRRRTCQLRARRRCSTPLSSAPFNGFGTQPIRTQGSPLIDGRAKISRRLRPLGLPSPHIPSAPNVVGLRVRRQRHARSQRCGTCIVCHRDQRLRVPRVTKDSITTFSISAKAAVSTRWSCLRLIRGC